jgi:membrane-bound lytic murein transglycosylase B
MLSTTKRRLLKGALGTLGTLAGPAWAQPLPIGTARPRRRPTKEAATDATRYAGHAEAMAFADAVAASHGLPAATVRQQLGQARRIDSVRRLVMPPPPGVAKNWAAYRARFIDTARVDAGLAFWRTHERWLLQADERWGVPPEIVAAVIGVETFYGRVMGNFRVIDALATLAFDFPPGRRDRSAFFRSELEELFVMAAREGSDPLSVKGSYAGALGLPQFMPSSVNRYAVDFDGDGHIDLRANAADVVGSVAHYLAAFGWQRGMPTHYGVGMPVDSRDRAVLLGPDIQPSFSAAQFAERGAQLDAAGQAHEGLLALVELQNGELAPSFVAGTENFYVITRYNWSSYYAMAVIDLAAALRRGFSTGTR